MVLQKVRYDRPPRALPAILLIISTFTSIIMWFPPSSYSVITLWLLIRSYIIDCSPLTGIKVHGCSLIHHNSWRSHHSAGPPTLAFGINILLQVHFTLGTFYEMNSESLLEHKRLWDAAWHFLKRAEVWLGVYCAVLVTNKTKGVKRNWQRMLSSENLNSILSLYSVLSPLIALI